MSLFRQIKGLKVPFKNVYKSAPPPQQWNLNCKVLFNRQKGHVFVKYKFDGNRRKIKSW